MPTPFPQLGEAPEPASRSRRGSLNGKILFFQFLFLGLLVLATWGIMMTVERRLLREQGYRLTTAIGEKVVSDIGQRVASTEALATALSQLGESLPADARLIESAIPNLLEGDDSSLAISGGALYFNPGTFDGASEANIFRWTKNSDGFLHFRHEQPATASAGFQEEQSYKVARLLEPGDSFWASPQTGEERSGPKVATCVVPIHREGKFIGVAHVNLLLEGLQQFFEKTAQSSGGGYIFAVDRSTKILSFPNSGQFQNIEELSQREPSFLPIAGRLNIVNEELKAQTAGFPKAATIAAGISEMNLDANEAELLLASLVDPLQGLGGTSSQAVQFPFLGCPITGEPATATVFHVPNTYWKIIIVTPDSLALAAADEITKQVTIMIIALDLALLGIMFLVFRRMVTTPVHEMSEKVEAMALSDGHSFEPLDESRSDELGYLAYQFNRRQAQLSKTFQDLAEVKASLETRVQERTAELSKANDELGRTARMKDEFLAGMSHELRTPLNAILGLSEAMKEGIYGPLNERQVKSLGSIEDGGRHLLALINDILDVAKIEAGELQLEPGRVAIQSVSESSVGFVKQQAAKKEIELTCQYHLTDPHFEADERRVKQILVNLLNNAVKFTPNGGKVGLTVHQHKEDGTVTFAISDTGIGIAEEDIEKLYKPFVQLDSRLNREHNGTGLGLSLVFHLVQMHGGQISVTSELERGSCFTVTLPLKLVEDAPPVSEPEDLSLLDAKLNTELKNAMVVEDSQAAAEQLSRYLSESGFRVHVETSGQDAFSLIKDRKPDIIILDLMLPGRSGWEILKELKEDEETAATPVVVISAVDQRKLGLESGASGYLVKPVSRDQFLQTIQAVQQPNGSPETTDQGLLASPDPQENNATTSTSEASESFQEQQTQPVSEPLSAALTPPEASQQPVSDPLSAALTPPEASPQPVSDPLSAALRPSEAPQPGSDPLLAALRPSEAPQPGSDPLLAALSPATPLPPTEEVTNEPGPLLKSPFAEPESAQEMVADPVAQETDSHSNTQLPSESGTGQTLEEESRGATPPVPVQPPLVQPSPPPLPPSEAPPIPPGSGVLPSQAEVDSPTADQPNPLEFNSQIPTPPPILPSPAIQVPGESPAGAPTPPAEAPPQTLEALAPHSQTGGNPESTSTSLPSQPADVAPVNPQLSERDNATDGSPDSAFPAGSRPFDGNKESPAISDLSQIEPPAPPAATPARPANSRPYVLLAEDNEVNISTFTDFLTAKGFEITVARNGEEAVSSATQRRPDIVLMDVQMPKMNGLQATQLIRANPNMADLPIITLTALAMAGDRERCLNAGATAYLSKPVQLKTLLETMIELLSNTSTNGVTVVELPS